MASSNASDVLRGTADFLMLRTIEHGPMHGLGTSQRIGQLSRDVLSVGEGFLCPALQRQAVRGEICGFRSLTRGARGRNASQQRRCSRSSTGERRPGEEVRCSRQRRRQGTGVPGGAAPRGRLDGTARRGMPMGMSKAGRPGG